MSDPIREMQIRVCMRFGAKPKECPPGLKVGISRNIRDGILPITGQRCKPVGDTTGWYIWAGDHSDDVDFYNPLHVAHLAEWCPTVLPYLLLPPGWCFQIAPGYEDVWFDSTVLVE